MVVNRMFEGTTSEEVMLVASEGSDAMLDIFNVAV